jgi:hypothetical protein
VAEEARRIGRFIVQTYTARQLVVEAPGKPLVVLGVMWGVFLPIAALIAPWQGGTRLLIALVAAVVLAAISFLVARFVPQRERIVVDVEAGVWRAERSYLFPPATRGIELPLEVVKAVRFRRRYWQDAPEVEAVRWAVELVGEAGETWQLAEGDDRQRMEELARVVAEVSGRPLAEGG